VRLVLAGRRDPGAAALIARWGPERAALVTAADLSRPGWRHHLRGGGRAAAALGDRVVPAEEVEAVVVRLADVPADELEAVRPEDRDYAAAEMTAFLLAWLDDRACPVLNRPTPGCLNGPAWWPEQWTLAAARAGVPVAPVRRRAGPFGTPDPEAPDPEASGEAVVTVVGDRCLGGVDPRLAGHARRLAAAAGTDLLAVRFAGPGPRAAFLGASAWPDLSDPDLASALDDHLEAAAC
jgi:hypothetical protein